MEACTLCQAHEDRLEKLERLVEFLALSLRFIAVATPIVTGVAMFIVVVNK